VESELFKIAFFIVMGIGILSLLAIITMVVVITVQALLSRTQHVTAIKTGRA
jgi:hypothetical protein